MRVARGVNTAERKTHVFEKIRPWPRQRGRTSDEDVVVAGFCGRGKNFGGGGLEAASRTIAHDGIADFARGGKSDAWVFHIAALTQLQHQPRSRPFAALRCG